MTLKSDFKAEDAIFKAGTTIAIHSVMDDFLRKQCSVNVSLTSPTVDAVRGIGAFAYAVTWEDEDVIDFIKTKMDL